MDKLLLKLESEYIGIYDCQLRYILNNYSILEIVNSLKNCISVEWSISDNLNYADLLLIARDFYIGSDLTENEKEEYYEELKRQDFFTSLNENLYSNDFRICNCIIYTIGKFSKSENAKYLECAYEDFYSKTNPILAKQCLVELTWLNSEKVKNYVSKLNIQNDIISKITLLMYWETVSDSDKIEKLITDKKLISFISPENDPLITHDLIMDRMNNFEIYMLKFNNENSKTVMTHNKFYEITERYFKSLINFQA